MESNYQNLPTIDDLFGEEGETATGYRCQEVPDLDDKAAREAGSFVQATLTALETGEITPLVKEELKYTIQSRRLAEGKSELEVKFEEPSHSEVNMIYMYTSI